jgi:CubicO group peptidase (beta-lactamase class C family)
MNRWTFTLVSMLSVAGVGAPQAQSGPTAPAPDLSAFDRYVAQTARDWRVPGLAIAIVNDDSTVFARGYGVLDLTKPDLVNEHTRFAIGSTTKAMTAAALGLLVDEGKLRWDDRIIDHLADFRLHDPYVTRELTVRDLLTHRSGLPSTDLLWARGDFSMAEMIRRLRHVEPSSSFRSQFEYQNVVYAIGGMLVETISGMQWEDFVRTRIFRPLEMEGSEPLVAGIASAPNVATPHANVRDTIRAVPMGNTDPIASAGSVWSSVSDMAKWMRFVLDSGRVGGERLLAANTFSELVTPQIRAPVSIYPALRLVQPHVFAYALGWFVQDYRGETVWMHTGSINGMSAIIGLLPDRRTGVFVLANLDHAELRHALMYKVFDMYTGNPERDWSADLRELFARARAGAPQEAPRPDATARPSLSVERYAGRYVDSTYGAVEVTVSDGVLRARFGNEDLGRLEPWEYEIFLTRGPPPRERQWTLTFVPDGRGNVTALQLFGVTFVRAARPQATRTP